MPFLNFNPMTDVPVAVDYFSHLIDNETNIPCWYQNYWMQLVAFGEKQETYSDLMHFSSILLDYTRERLNTGHWSDVQDCWRKIYAAIRFLTVCKTLNFAEECNIDFYISNLGLVDDGLIMGVTIMNNLGQKLALVLHKIIVEKSEQAVLSDENLFFSEKSHFTLHLPVSSRLKLQRLDSPSLSEFTTMIEEGKPFILTQTINHWPAVSIWNLNYWKSVAGYRTVPIEIGTSYTECDWSQKLLTINEFISRFIVEGEKPVGYLAQHQLFLQIPELEQDIDVPDYCFVKNVESKVDTNIWFGPKDTVSPLHHDSEKHNLLCQVKGFKYVNLFTKSESPYLYAHEEKMLNNTSKIDLRSVDFNEFPELRNATSFEGIIQPGDVLYIPPFCWHFITALSCSFSVNFWWK
ncbi:Lysine-specific demethylase 8 [Cichlidogyrus casuarinus]|uniref:Lysine-specific demethylase 8 n=1 Tax=Cichlidogyrus casuarinus TaxID=1844966 RepID=A0ABD2QKN7_9PLAT